MPIDFGGNSDVTFSGSVVANFPGDLANLAFSGTDDHEVFAIGVPGPTGHLVAGTATTPLYVAGSISAVSTVAHAKNYRGSSAGVVVNTVQTLVSVPVSGYALRGFLGNGTADGYYTLQLNGTVIYQDFTNRIKMNANVTLPNPELVTGTLQLKVENQGLGTADYWGVVMGEV